MKRRIKSTDDRPEGLWVSPSGERIPAVEHLITIRDYPELFGLDDSVRSISIEALAIVGLDLIKHGWIRFRPWSGLYTFEVSNAKRRIDEIEQILVDVDAFEGENVRISQTTPKREFVGFVSELFERTIFKYQENPRGNRWRLS